VQVAHDLRGLELIIVFGGDPQRRLEQSGGIALQALQAGLAWVHRILHWIVLL
jgi:hypothetical protein